MDGIWFHLALFGLILADGYGDFLIAKPGFGFKYVFSYIHGANSRTFRAPNLLVYYFCFSVLLLLLASMFRAPLQAFLAGIFILIASPAYYQFVSGWSQFPRFRISLDVHVNLGIFSNGPADGTIQQDSRNLISRVHDYAQVPQGA